VLFSRRIQSLYQRIENRFLTNLNAREAAAAKQGNIARNILRNNAEIQSNMEPWDAHIVEMKVSPNAGFIGKTLLELGWRQKFGINIVYIKRGDKLIHVPGRDNRLMPFDEVGVLATDAQIQSFKPMFDTQENITAKNLNADDISLHKFIVDEHNKFNGMEIQSLVQEKRISGLIVGIERNKERILNPESNMKLEWGDVVWMVGDKKKIQQINQDV
jgi:CPA2 family monovalent cation:H+ antiporter-2